MSLFNTNRREVICNLFWCPDAHFCLTIQALFLFIGFFAIYVGVAMVKMTAVFATGIVCTTTVPRSTVPRRTHVAYVLLDDAKSFIHYWTILTLILCTCYR